jgi:hypothetical protein
MSLEKPVEALRLFVDTLDNAVQVLRPELGSFNKWNWDPGKIKWVKAEGFKGPYERADPKATPDFKAMLADLEAHNGKLTRNGLFNWVFQDQATVGRKERGTECIFFIGSSRQDGKEP